MAEQKLKQANVELEKTLDDFYTVRLGLQKDLELNRVEEENKKIKAKIDNIKKSKG